MRIKLIFLVIFLNIIFFNRELRGQNFFGIGSVIATPRDVGDWRGTMTAVGYSSSIILKFDMSYRHFSYFARFIGTYNYIIPVMTNTGLQIGTDYGIGMLVLGVEYSVHLRPIPAWLDGYRGKKAARF